MKAFLFCSPEFSTEIVQGVVNFLNSIPGEIKFEAKESLRPEFFTDLNIEFAINDENSELSFDEIFRITKLYRSSQSIEPDDFVVFITSIRNEQQWFSAFNKKDIFIHGAEWDLISNIESKFELAYQCIENIFQSLINLRVDEYHEEPKCCINDFCGNKSKILYKLQSGNICPECFKRARQYGLNDVFLSQLINTLDTIRREFSVAKTFSEGVKLDTVEVKENGDIWIGDKYLDLEFRLNILYLGFLKNVEGIPSPFNCDDKQIFQKIYDALSLSPDEQAIPRVFCKKLITDNRVKFENNKLRFFQYKTKVNDAIKLLLGESLSSSYEIQRRQNQDGKWFFRVELKKEQIKFPKKFSKSAR